MGALARAEEVFGEADRQYAELVKELKSGETMRMDHSDLESLLGTKGRELLRQLLESHVKLRGQNQISEPVVSADGREQRYRRVNTRNLETVFGPVSVEREGRGTPGGPTLYPLDGELNLPGELYSFGIRRLAGEAAARSPFREVQRILEDHTGTLIGNRQVEHIVIRAAADFDGFYEVRRDAAKGAPGDGQILVLSFDGKGVPMRPEALREATRLAAAQRRPKLEKRLSKGEKRHTRRMAEVAAVYTIAPFVRTPEDVMGGFGANRTSAAKRPPPEGKRVWASVAKPMEMVIEDAFQDALLRDPAKTRDWVVLVDGNAEQIRLAQAAAARHGVAITLILDIIHVIEYLWRASHAFHREGSSEAEAWVSERLLHLLEGDPSQVAAGIRRSATLRNLSSEKRKAVDVCANYIIDHRSMMGYKSHLARGRPIATGVIEGACRYLVGDRMNVTGARWGLVGAEAVLRLRSLHASGDFPEYWKHHQQMEYNRNHASRYHGKKVPKTAPPSGTPHLRLVT